MSITVESGRAFIVDNTAGGAIVFDTNERLFHTTNGPISGTISFPTRTAQRIITSSSNVHNHVDVNVSTIYTAVHPLANFVRGQMYVSVPSGPTYGVSNRGWFDASGTYVHYLGPNNAASGAAGNVALRSIAAYTFFASGGYLYFNERTRLDAPRSLSNGTYTLTLPGPTLQFKLWVGTFT